MFWVALKAGSRSGTCADVGTPTVPLAYSSAKKSRHILETHWLGFSILIVILARGHGSGNVERQCNSSDVSSGAVTGSSPSFGRYCIVAVALLLLRCVWVLAARCADWMMAMLVNHSSQIFTCTDGCPVLGPSSVWFLAAVARMSRASPTPSCESLRNNNCCLRFLAESSGVTKLELFQPFSPL